LDEKSQEQILARPINFQGTNVPLFTLVGTDTPDSIKSHLDSDVISILLSNEPKLSVGRQLGDRCKYYVPRGLQHQIYLKEDILKRTDYAVTFAVSGLQADKLKKYYLLARKYVNLYMMRVKEVILSKLFLISLRLDSSLDWRI
jgi:hypothetical protein